MHFLLQLPATSIALPLEPILANLLISSANYEYRRVLVLGQRVFRLV